MAKPIAPQLRSGPHGPGKPNAATQKIRDDRAIAQAAGKRYVRPVTPANTNSASARGTATPAKAGVNKATQAVRDARAVAKAGGDRYTRKVEQYVNKATQAKRIARASAGRQVKTPPVVVEPPDAQQGAVDWQKKAGEYNPVPNQPGINPAFDITNADAQYKADANVKYRDVDGTIGWREIAKNLRAQVVKAMKAGKTMVVLPDGEKWAAHQSTLDLIDRNLAAKD